MNILILQASPRANGNTAWMAEEYKTVVAPNPVPENKQLLIIPEATHCDLYDGGFTGPAGHGESKNLIPWDTLAEFFGKNLK